MNIKFNNGFAVMYVRYLYCHETVGANEISIKFLDFIKI